MPRARHGHCPCSFISAALLEISALHGLTGSFAHLWGPRRKPAHMQASRQRRPRQTPTMMPVTECTSKEPVWGREGGQDRSPGEGPGFLGQDFYHWFPQGTTGLNKIFFGKDRRGHSLTETSATSLPWSSPLDI